MSIYWALIDMESGNVVFDDEYKLTKKDLSYYNAMLSDSSKAEVLEELAWEQFNKRFTIEVDVV